MIMNTEFNTLYLSPAISLSCSKILRRHSLLDFTLLFVYLPYIANVQMRSGGKILELPSPLPKFLFMYPQNVTTTFRK
jgi:uncharacterized metal-binding protein